MWQPERHGFWQSERGFTLPEMIIVIVLMGIVLAIASSSWFGMVESRRVDSAANQVASDLRLAHTRATNRLADWPVVFNAGASTYEIGPAGSSSTRTLSDGSRVATTVTLTFKADGSVTASPGSVSSIRVEAENNSSKFHTIEFNTATSRVKVVP